MKTRDFRTRRLGCYGPAWERVRRLPCFWLRVEAEHVCETGHTGGHTAHHYRPVGSGGHDQDGLLPCCGSIHDMLHGWGADPSGGGYGPRLTLSHAVQEKLGKSLAVLAVEYFRGEECGYDLAY